MAERTGREGPDYAELCTYLRALAVPNRLQMLRKLQLPHTLAEIDLPAVRPRGSLGPRRPLSRQAVQEHLAKLRALGLVLPREGLREGRVVREYAVNHARLFVVVEELRQLALLRAPGLAAEATQPGQAARTVRLPAGPSLVLVGGPQEGAAFPLGGPGPWVVGRDEDCEVALPYDPFVSKANTRLRREGPVLLAEALPRARNGTRVNWNVVPEGVPFPIATGDLLGVGRSLLVARGV